MNGAGSAEDRPLSLARLLAALVTVIVAALLAVIVAGACFALPAASAAVADETLAPRQLLVMLRMPAPHFRAGADYGGSYGTGAGSDPGRPARRRVAEDLAQEHGLRLVDDWPMAVIGVDCYVMEAPAGTQAPRLSAQLAALARDPRVAWAQPVSLFHGMEQAGSAADPLYPLQPAARAWHVAELQRVSTGRGVRVAVIDSGVDGRHPDLADQVTLRENFVDQGDPPPEAHGTAVAGIIAARAGNGLGIAGVAPGARLMALRACWEPAGQGALCSSFTLAKALNFAILHEARIINLSLGGPADRLLQTLVEAAGARGATVVAALDPARPGGFPGAAPAVLAVGVGEGTVEGARAGGSTLLAPGADVPSCLPGARWGFVSGTSYAAAHVSGLAALLAQLRPHAGPTELRSYMVTQSSSATLEHTANRGADPASGVTIDACASIARAFGTCVCSCHPIAKLKANRSPQVLP
jgi:subtilisin family serine protease